MNHIEDLVFWSACVRLKPFREHVEAAAAGGFTSMSIAPDTYRDARKAGMSGLEIRNLAEEAGVPIRHFDTLSSWAPIRVPPNASREMRERFDVSMDEALDICAELDISTILAVAGYPPGSIPHDVLVEGFADLCDRVAAAGVWVDLEFMPILGLPTLEAAWSIVSEAARPNSGVLVDTWHFVKGGSSLETLKKIDSRYLRSMQLSDGFIAMRGEDLVDDMLSWREFPGEGQLNVLQTLNAVEAAGSLTRIGCEVFSHRANAMTARKAGTRSGTTTRRILVEAGLDVHGRTDR
ncbi:sugar phosphate isomerase/epimerase family protein [Paraburkholderia sp. D1E]|uniref:sugar phosphate isomerase/epimerase family protein n=1 Tax=Paraburkholderia sp. D1E TaxID=3461398 RepID=UPI0040454198